MVQDRNSATASQSGEDSPEMKKSLAREKVIARSDEVEEEIADELKDSLGTDGVENVLADHQEISAGHIAHIYEHQEANEEEHFGDTEGDGDGVKALRKDADHDGLVDGLVDTVVIEDGVVSTKKDEKMMLDKSIDAGVASVIKHDKEKHRLHEFSASPDNDSIGGESDVEYT